MHSFISNQQTTIPCRMVSKSNPSLKVAIRTWQNGNCQETRPLEIKAQEDPSLFTNDKDEHVRISYHPCECTRAGEVPLQRSSEVSAAATHHRVVRTYVSAVD